MRQVYERETAECVRWWPDRGFGFLRVGDGSEDVFCHYSQLPKGVSELSRGEVVQFSRVPGVKGYRAADVRLA